MTGYQSNASSRDLYDAATSLLPIYIVEIVGESIEGCYAAISADDYPKEIILGRPSSFVGSRAWEEYLVLGLNPVARRATVIEREQIEEYYSEFVYA